MESFWSTLKLGLVCRHEFPPHRQARSDIFDVIETFHNRQRRHTSFDGLSPADFELKDNYRSAPFSLSVLSMHAQWAEVRSSNVVFEALATYSTTIR